MDSTVPAKTPHNLLIATWNIRALGDLTAKWTAGPKDSPKRDWHAIACLAEVISRFHVVAVQEVRRNPKALKHLLTTLGPAWQAIVSDVTLSENPLRLPLAGSTVQTMARAVNGALAQFPVASLTFERAPISRCLVSGWLAGIGEPVLPGRTSLNLAISRMCSEVKTIFPLPQHA